MLPVETIQSAQSKCRARAQLREATLADYCQVAALQIRNGFEPYSPAQWTRYWRDNPTFRLAPCSWPIGWVLETNNGDIVGWMGNILTAYQFRGQWLFAASPSSWVVDRTHRGFGWKLLNRMLQQKNIDLFIASNISSVSEPFAGHVGFSKVPVGQWDLSEFWITNHRGFAKVILEKEYVPAARLAAWLVSAGLHGWSLLKKDHVVRRRHSPFEVAPCSSFDGRFDRFWENLQNENEDVLLAARSKEILEWHFRSGLKDGNVWVLTSFQGNRLTAYAIFDRQDNPLNALRRVRLVDFQCAKGAEKTIVSALGWMLEYCQQQQIHVLEVNGSWLRRRRLPRIAAPYERKMPSWRFYYKAVDQAISVALNRAQAWAPSSFDGDASLC